MSAIYTIHQIMPLSIPMSACFYDHDELEVTRRDVVCLAIVKFGVEGGSESAVIRPMVCEKSGAVIDPVFLPDFLGFEVNGAVENWDEKVEEILAKIEEKTFKFRKAVN